MPKKSVMPVMPPIKKSKKASPFGAKKALPPDLLPPGAGEPEGDEGGMPLPGMKCGGKVSKMKCGGTVKKAAGGKVSGRDGIARKGRTSAKSC